MNIKKLTDKITSIEICNKNNMKMEVLTLGGIIRSIIMPNGEDIVLGYDDITQYYDDDAYFGAAVGRYANRISGAKFELNGVTYSLDKNCGDNTLHGGFKGLTSRNFEYRIHENTIKLYYTLLDMSDNFPGDLDIEIDYTLTDDNELIIEYTAVSSKDTIINLTNHTYFNLNGQNGNVLGQKLKINSSKITFNDENSVPTGEIIDITGTAMDFTEFKEIGRDINADDINIKHGGGYDHNYIVNDTNELVLFAEAIGEKASFEAYTDSPCVQLYTGNFISDRNGKYGKTYSVHSGFCLETGEYPDAINKPNFKSPILKASEEWKYKTIFKFK